MMADGPMLIKASGTYSDADYTVQCKTALSKSLTKQRYLKSTHTNPR